MVRASTPHPPENCLTENSDDVVDDDDAVAVAGKGCLRPPAAPGDDGRGA